VLKYNNGKPTELAPQSITITNPIFNPRKPNHISHHGYAVKSYVFKEISSCGMYVLAIWDENQDEDKFDHDLLRNQPGQWVALCFNTLSEKFIKIYYECPDWTGSVLRRTRRRTRLTSATVWEDTLILRFWWLGDLYGQYPIFLTLRACQIGNANFATDTLLHTGHMCCRLDHKEVFLDDHALILATKERIFLTRLEQTPQHSVHSREIGWSEESVNLEREEEDVIF
jgi:hypothetical protein